MIKKLLLLIFVASFGIKATAQKIHKMTITDVVNYFSKQNDTVYVVNFWATFCKPCNEELPDMIRIVKKYEGQKVKLLLVSLDLPEYFPAKITSFAKKHNYNTNLAWLNESNADIFCPMIDKKWSGAIPATIIVNNKTGFKKFVEDQMKPEEFEAVIKLAIVRSAFNNYQTDPVKEPQ